MMYTLEQLQEYKLNKCKNSKCPPGKRQLCWYYHDAYDRRRPVSNGMNPNQPYKYFHEDCNQHGSSQNKCKDEDDCKFAHNEYEKNFHPMMVKKEQCEKKKNLKCNCVLPPPENVELCDRFLNNFCSKYHQQQEKQFFESSDFRFNLEQYNVLLEKVKKERISFVFSERKYNHETLQKDSISQQIPDQRSRDFVSNKLDETEIIPIIFDSDTSYMESRNNHQDNKSSSSPLKVNNAVNNNIKDKNNTTNNQSFNMMNILNDLESSKDESLHEQQNHNEKKISPSRYTDNNQIISQSIVADNPFISQEDYQPQKTINQCRSEGKHPRQSKSEEEFNYYLSIYSPQVAQKYTKTKRNLSQHEEIQDTQHNACELRHQNERTPYKNDYLSPQIVRGNRSISATRPRQRQSSKSASHKKYSLERISKDNYQHSEENLEKVRNSVSKSYYLGDQFSSEESEWLELKDYSLKKNESLNVDRIIKTIIGFLNHKGGFIVFGVSDEYEVIGVSKSLTKESLQDRLRVELEKCQPVIEWGRQIVLLEKVLETNYQRDAWNNGNQKKLLVIEVKPQKDWTKQFVDGDSKYYLRSLRSVVTLNAKDLVNHLKEQGKQKKEAMEDISKKQQEILKDLSKQLTKWQNELSVEEFKEKAKEMLKKAKRLERLQQKVS